MSDLDQPDRRRRALQPGEVCREGGQNLTESLRETVDGLTARSASADPLPGGRFARTHSFQDHQRARPIARGEKGVGESQAQPLLARAGRPTAARTSGSASALRLNFSKMNARSSAVSGASRLFGGT